MGDLIRLFYNIKAQKPSKQQSLLGFVSVKKAFSDQ
jgi:hypothetical protein